MKSPVASGSGIRTASADTSMADQPPAAMDVETTNDDADDAMRMSDDEEGELRERFFDGFMDEVFYVFVRRPFQAERASVTSTFRRR